jgi:hypothetical protein
VSGGRARLRFPGNLIQATATGFGGWGSNHLGQSITQQRKFHRLSQNGNTRDVNAVGISRENHDGNPPGSEKLEDIFRRASAEVPVQEHGPGRRHFEILLELVKGCHATGIDARHPKLADQSTAEDGEVVRNEHTTGHRRMTAYVPFSVPHDPRTITQQRPEEKYLMAVGEESR